MMTCSIFLQRLPGTVLTSIIFTCITFILLSCQHHEHGSLICSLFIKFPLRKGLWCSPPSPLSTANTKRGRKRPSFYLVIQPDILICMFYLHFISFFASCNKFVNILGTDSGYITYVHRYHPYFKLIYKLCTLSYYQ